MPVGPTVTVGGPTLPYQGVAAARGVRARWGVRRALRAGQYMALAAITCMNVLPLAWIALSSFKPDGEIIQYPPTFLPHTSTLQNYAELFAMTPFAKYLANSVTVAALSTAIVVTLASCASYAFTRFTYRFVRYLAQASLAAYMIPSVLLLVPVTRLMLQWHLDNNVLSVVLIYSAHLLPFGLWILRSYYQGVALDLEQAAMVDGCARFGAFLRVVLPQAVPGMLATGIFTFNAAWSEYMFAATLLTSPGSMTLSPGLALLNTISGVVQWGMVMGGAMLMVLPLLVLFIVGQRFLVPTWGEGAVKG